MTSMIHKKYIIILVALMSLMMSVSAYALIGIKTVSIKVESDIKLGERISNEDISVTVSGGKYSVYETVVQNEGFTWTTEHTPEFIVYLEAAEGYYFNITKASSVKVTGATYKSAARENSSQTLAVTIRLDALASQFSNPEDVVLSQAGLCTWSAGENVGSYEVKLTRGNSTIGGIQTTTATSLDVGEFITRTGTYQVSVRSTNALDAALKGRWVRSAAVSFSQSDIDAIKANPSHQGQWMLDSVGWWYRMSDGTYPASSWKQVDGQWYYFRADGYMATGWIHDGSAWYYLDTTSGAMWKNTTTPDGYYVDITGAYR